MKAENDLSDLEIRRSLLVLWDPEVISVKKYRMSGNRIVISTADKAN